MPQWSTVDFAVEIIGSLKYYVDALRGKPGTRETRSELNLRKYDSWTGEGVAGPGRKMDFGTAFGVYQRRTETDRQLQLEINRGKGAHSSYDGTRPASYGYQEGEIEFPRPRHFDWWVIFLSGIALTELVVPEGRRMR